MSITKITKDARGNPKLTLAEYRDYNHNHEPAGTPEGGQFAESPGGESARAGRIRKQGEAMVAEAHAAKLKRIQAQGESLLAEAHERKLQRMRENPEAERAAERAKRVAEFGLEAELERERKEKARRAG